MNDSGPQSRSRRFRWRRQVARARWQPDKWERLTLVAQMVPPDARSVLDVGGRGGEMGWLLSPARVVSVNVEEPADVVMRAEDPLPFAADEFDTVTSTDVLEHMPAESRARHIAELVRVARRRVVLCFPYGSEPKDAAERLLHTRLRDELGVRLDFLEEHLAYGLPREDDVRRLVATAAPGATVRSCYQEGVDYGVDIVMDGMRAKHRKDVRALARFAWRGYLRRTVELVDTASADSSRIFLVVDL